MPNTAFNLKNKQKNNPKFLQKNKEVMMSPKSHMKQGVPL